MTFVINKDNDERIIKKTLNFNKLATVTQSISLGSSYSVFSIDVPSIDINHITFSDANILNSATVTPGIGESSKLLVLNSNYNISNINILKCNTITLNNNTITGPSNNVPNIYLNNAIPGTSIASKALILDSNKNISNINSINVNNNLSLNNSIIDISSKFKNFSYTKNNINNINNWISVCWSPELYLFVAISNSGTGNRIITSTDGITWITRTSAADNNWTSICWSSTLSLFVAVSSSGTGNRVMISNNGINWSSQTSSSDNNWTSICWSPTLNLFVAVASSGTGNRVMTSSNGITWTSQTSPADNNWTSVCYSNDLSLFVAVASSGTSNRVMTSIDGISWTLRTSSDDNSWNSICWASDLNLFVVVASTGTNRVMVSSNGISWNSYNIIFNFEWINIIWISEYKMLLANCINNLNSPKIIYSYNAINWFSLNTPQTCNINTIGFSPSLKQFCCLTKPCVEVTFNKNILSHNLILGFKDLIWINNLSLYIAVGSNGKIYTSSNGTTWTIQTGQNLNYGLIQYSPSLNLIIAYSESGTGFSTSSDGITWTSQSSANNKTWKSLIWSPELSLFVLNNTTDSNTYTSSNGISWTTNTGTAANLQIKWISALNLFIGVGNNAISTSSNGTNWTSRTVPEANNWVDFDYSPSLNLLVAISSNGTNRIMTSSNGLTWIVSSIMAKSWSNILWISSLNIFIVVCGDNSTNLMLQSIDGITWTYLNNNMSNTIRKIIYNSNNNVLLITNSDLYNDYFYISNTLSYNTFSILNNILVNSNNSYNLTYNNEKIYIKKSAIKYGLNNWYGITGISTPSLSADVWNKVVWIGYPFMKFYISSLTTNVLYSSDVHNWTQMHYSASYRFNDVAYSPELNIAMYIGTNSAAYKAFTITNDGTTFNWMTSFNLANNWSSVCWSAELNMFVVVASSGALRIAIYKPNKNIWNYIKTPLNSWTSICWSPELNLFVAVANSGTGNRVMTSSNGYNWISRTSAANNNWTSICWSPELNLFVAVANSGSGDRIMTSSNGITWNSQICLENNNWNQVIWVSQLQLFIAVASTGTNRIMYSFDGINWIFISLSVNNSWTSICYSPELAVLLLTSSSGTTRLYMSHFFKSTDFNTKIIPYSQVFSNNKLRSWIASNYNYLPTHQCEIGGSLGLYNSSGTLNSLISMSTSSGLNLNSGSYSINISDHNGIDSGLALNNQLVLATGQQINSIYSLILGSTIENKALSIDNNYNLVGLNTVSCNSITVNNLFNSITPGTASILNLLVCDTNNNIYEINNLSTNTLKLNNVSIVSNKIINNNLNNNLIIQRTSTINGISSIYSIVWAPELNIYVAVSYNYSSYGAASSSDGIVWNCGGVFSVSNGLYDVCWSPSLRMFMTMDTNTYNFYYSYNGITWQLTTVPLAYTWQTITWSSSLNLFVAVGSSAANGTSVITSPDGFNWTIQTAPDAPWWSIIVAKNMLIVIGTYTLMTSTDAINWTSKSVPNAHNWRAIAYSPSLDLFVIVANSGNYRIAYSSDLINWTSIASPINNSWSSLIWIPEKSMFVATAISGTNTRIMMSSNGINWYIRNNLNINAGFMYRMAWSPSLSRLIIPTVSNYLVYTNFSPYDSYNKNIYLDTLQEKISINYSNSQYMINNWIPRSSSSTNQWVSIVWSNYLNIYVAISNTGTGNRIMTSSDSITWTSRTSPVDNNWTSICWARELLLFVVIASSGTGNRVMTSSDGINWTSRTSPVDNNWTSICWSPELYLFVAVASSGTGDRVMTSSDGINWTSRTSPVDNNWTSVCWANNINTFIAVSNTGTQRIMLSNDGINWSLTYAPAFNQSQINWIYCTWINELNMFIAISNSTGRRIMYSYNAIDWKLSTFNITNNFTCICWNPKLAIFIIISSNGTNQIYSSLIGYATEYNCITPYPTQISINNISNYIGLGMSTPSYTLHLSQNSAAKLTTSTWTVSSDKRLKENIEDADIDLCYNNIKNLPLKKYTWKADIYSDLDINDRTKLGWIADDVEPIFPKSVIIKNLFNVEDCKTLNNDQIIASLYGAIKKLINISKKNNNDINQLENQYNEFKSFIDSLDISEE